MYKISGYASVFGNIDYDGEIVAPGAFSEFLKTGQQLPLYFGHSIIQGPFILPIGVTESIEEDSHGLFFSGVIASTREGEDINKLLEIGAIKEMSFGYEILDFYMDGKTRILTNLRPYEITLAESGSNPLTSVQLTKSKTVSLLDTFNKSIQVKRTLTEVYIESLNSPK